MTNFDRYEHGAAVDAAIVSLSESIQKTFSKERLLAAGAWLSQDTVPARINGENVQVPVCDAVGELCAGDYEGVSSILFKVLQHSECPMVEGLRKKLAAEWIDLHAHNVAAGEV